MADDLTTADGLQEYVNANIRNDPAKAFTNLRLNNALLGTLELIKQIDSTASASTYRDEDF